MAQTIINVYTPNGTKLGYFLNPKIDVCPDDQYLISGQFLDEVGNPISKLEFNPEAVPYHIDLSPIEKASHNRLVKVYVQRGRQPIEMIGNGAN